MPAYKCNNCGHEQGWRSNLGQPCPECSEGELEPNQ